MRKSIAVFLFTAVAAISPPPALAGPITVPTGLHPGDQYRLAFVTSTTRDATSSSMFDYDAFVRTAANSEPVLAALGTTWGAIASVVFFSAVDNTNTVPGGPSVPIYSLSDNLIASSYSDLWDGTIDSPIHVDEHGNLVNPTYVWTGTRSDGLRSRGFGLGTQIPGQPIPTPVVGDTYDTGPGWINNTTADWTTRYPLFGLSGVLTVPTPEPSSMVLACLAVAGLAVPSLRRRRSQQRPR